MSQLFASGGQNIIIVVAYIIPGLYNLWSISGDWALLQVCE